jgi:hypothetical protein
MSEAPTVRLMPQKWGVVREHNGVPRSVHRSNVERKIAKGKAYALGRRDRMGHHP